MTRPLLENRLARRLFLDRHFLLGAGPAFAGNDAVKTLLNGLGFVQVDSVNTMARAHDLILWSRLGSYRPKALERLIAKSRAAFEHWTHDAAVIPIESYPMWRLKFERDEARMRARWPAGRRAGWETEISAVLRHVEENGPTCSLDVGTEEPKSSSGWWDWHPSKTALEFLWRSGRLAICHRKGFRKHYDLPERVIPAQLRLDHRDNSEIVDWAMWEALQRLGFGTSGELAAFFEIASRDEARAWCAKAQNTGRIMEVDVELANGTIRRCFTTQNLLSRASELSEPSKRVRVLSPFDPALRDRARAERLFGFHYRIEIFVPEAKRKYGYYVFPVQQGDQMIGRIDMRRDGATMKVRAFWPEPGIRMGKARTGGLEAELNRLRHLAGVSHTCFENGWLRE